MNVSTLVSRLRNHFLCLSSAGAHSFGQAHCSSSSNAGSAERPDAGATGKNLMRLCNGDIKSMPGMPGMGGMPDHEGMTPMAFMDPSTPTEFDTKVSILNSYTCVCIFYEKKRQKKKTRNIVAFMDFHSHRV